MSKSKEPYEGRLHTDCFGYEKDFDGNSFCSALNEIECEGCVFYKTKEQVEAERKKTRTRLERLGRETEETI